MIKKQETPIYFGNMNIKRIIFGLVVFIAILNGINALIYYNISTHQIFITITDDGLTTVTEKFILNFSSEKQLDNFKTKKNELGVSLDSWEKFDPKIKIHIGTKKDVQPLSGTISFVEAENNYLQMEYALHESIVSKKTETSRSIDYELKKNYFNSFLEKPFYKIPANTEIYFMLPSKSTADKKDINPEPFIGSDESYFIIKWQGLKETSNLSLKYTYWKEIAPAISISLIWKNFLDNASQELKILIFIILAAIIGAFYFKRKKINEKIQTFVETNSALEK